MNLDRNECADGSHSCGDVNYCMNLPGEYFCICPPGEEFMEDKKNCKGDEFFSQ